MAPNDFGFQGGQANTFYRVLSQAINEMAEVGFDNSARLAYWINRIRDAAVQSLIPEHILESTLNQAFRATFRRLVEKGGITKFHPGIGRFTLEKVRPALRAELDRRMMISRNLIKLNRAEAIEATVRRFAGWASSVPDGGTGAVDKRETKAEIRKALASLPFTERRVAVDQGHKFVANLNNILATDGGAIAGEWHSNFRQRNYAYREHHKERDGKFYVVRGNWALASSLMKTDGHKYMDEITMPGEEVFCLPGDTRIPFADGVEKSYRHWFNGELAEIITSSGKSLRATPNHPVLTPDGWVAIGLLNEGDDVIEIGDQGVGCSVAEQHENYAIPLISEIFGTFVEVGVTKVARGSSEQFHGDGSNSDVDIISVARPLTFGRKSASRQGVDQFLLSMSDHFRALSSALEALYIRCLATGSRHVSCFCEAAASLWSFSFHTQDAGLRYSPGINSSFLEARFDGSATDAETFGYGQHAISGSEALDHIRRVKEKVLLSGKAVILPPFLEPLENGHPRGADDICDLIEGIALGAKSVKVVKVNRNAWSGHVYNLQTTSGWYVAEGIITHNCRCSYTYFYSLRALPPDMVTEKGRAELARAKALVGA